MSVARVYKLPIENASLGATAMDVFTLINSTGKDAIFHGFSLTSAQGATAAENARLQLCRPSTDGSGGTTATSSIVPANPANTVTSNMTAIIGRNTPGTFAGGAEAWLWSQQGELLFLPTPEIRLVIPASGRLALRILAALAAGRSMSGWVAWEEL